MTSSLRILITGSDGLIGSSLSQHLHCAGYEVIRYDINPKTHETVSGNILDYGRLELAATGCSGIVHLAAISRVVWGEQNPQLCWDTNVEGTRTALSIARKLHPRPWFILASSREVYGKVQELPVQEDVALHPINTYGRSKMAAEALALEARRDELKTAVLRFSNVYGSVTDHDDRVVPAFARAAACGTPLRLDGRDSFFDFTYLADTVRGIIGTIEALENGASELPPIHLVTGKSTSLAELAQLAQVAGGGRSRLIDAPPRSFDVSQFCGDPTRAQTILGWSATTSIEAGMSKLVREFGQLENAQTLAGAQSLM